MATTICRAAIALGTLLAAGAAAAQGTGALSPEQRFEQAAPSVWTVRTFDAQGKPLAGGSAVVIGPGSLVTNCHVLTRAKGIALVHDNVSYGAVLDQRDPERDLCLLKARNFQAPAARLGPPEELKTGARVYAIGSPRGLEQTISDGLLSGIRRTEDGRFMALQVTVPISPGSSGGGLFDAHGRLVGITTFQLREAQNINFALPASWIAEVAERAQAVATARPEAHPVVGLQAAAAASATAYEYRLTDHITHKVQQVVYQVDRVDGDNVIFNGGARVEKRDGEMVSVGAALAGECDLAMPPEGWFKPGAELGTTWSTDYLTSPNLRLMRLQLRARVAREEALPVPGQQMKTLRIEYAGYIDRSPGTTGGAMGRFQAVAWYAPELGRLIRFEVVTRGGSSGAQFVIKEQLELVAIR